MEIYKIYNYKIILKFDEVKHHYWVNGVMVDSVTGILNIINKPALINWAVKCTTDYVREHLKPGRSYDEIEIEELVDEAKRASRKVGKAAASMGTIAHKYAEDYIKNKTPEKPINEKIRKATDSFELWATNVEFIKSEQKVYSKRYNYAGTFDALVKIKKGIDMPKGTYIIDLKTSSALYPEYYLQLAAYLLAYQEEYPEEKINGGALIRIGKDGSFEIKYKLDKKEINQDKEAFLAALDLYGWLNK